MFCAGKCQRRPSVSVLVGSRARRALLLCPNNARTGDYRDDRNRKQSIFEDGERDSASRRRTAVSISWGPVWWAVAIPWEAVWRPVAIPGETVWRPVAIPGVSRYARREQYKRGGQRCYTGPSSRCTAVALGRFHTPTLMMQSIQGNPRVCGSSGCRSISKKVASAAI